MLINALNPAPPRLRKAVEVPDTAITNGFSLKPEEMKLVPPIDFICVHKLIITALVGGGVDRQRSLGRTGRMYLMVLEFVPPCGSFVNNDGSYEAGRSAHPKGSHNQEPAIAFNVKVTAEVNVASKARRI